MHKHKDKKKNDNKKTELTKQPSTSASHFTRSNDTQIESENETNSFNKRTLTTNWSKYEETDPIDDSEQLGAADFENLLVTPASVGSHFVFNTERNWENNIEATSTYFKLNVTDLSRTLSSVPFYERQGYAAELFDSAEIREMDKKARQMQQTLRKNSNTLVKPKQKSLDKENASPEVVLNVETPMPDKTALTNLTQPIDDTDELNALLEFTVHPISSITKVPLESIANLKITTPASTKANADIQQWLDDIFDD